MSALTPEQLDKLTGKVSEALNGLFEAFYEAVEEGGHMAGGNGARGACRQCGTRWPCHPVDQVLKLNRGVHKALTAFGVDLDVLHQGGSHQPVTVARELAELREKYGDEALREAVAEQREEVG